MPIETVSIGVVKNLVFDTTYALPPRQVLIHVQQAGGNAVGVSDNVGGPFAAVVLDANNQFEASGGFILAVIADALVRLTAKGL